MTTRTNPAHRVAVFGSALAAAALALTLGPASPALAHDQLVGTTPADHAVLEAAPEELILSFNNSLIEVGTVIKVTAPDGSSAAEGEPRFSGRDALQTLKADLPHGDYQVVWRVVSSDGHPISGAFDFTVGTAGNAEVPATAEPSGESAGSDAPSSETADASLWASPLLWAGIAGSVALVAVVIALSVRSAKRRANDPDSAE